MRPQLCSLMRALGATSGRDQRCAPPSAMPHTALQRHKCSFSNTERGAALEFGGATRMLRCVLVVLQGIANALAQDRPVSTLQAGLRIAQELGRRSLFVGEGVYSSAETLELVEGVSIFGGYSGLPDWTRGHTDEHITHIVSEYAVWCSTRRANDMMLI